MLFDKAKLIAKPFLLTKGYKPRHGCKHLHCTIVVHMHMCVLGRECTLSQNSEIR